MAISPTRFFLSRSNVRWFHPSLTRTTLIKMGLSLAGIIVASTGASYLYLMDTLQESSRENLKNYVIERGKQEESLFRLAEDNHTLFRNKLLQRLTKMDDQDSNKQLEHLLFNWSDGTARNFPENKPLEKFDTEQYSTILLSKQTAIQSKNYSQVLAAYQLLNAYGAAWHNRFVNTYLITSENSLVGYFPGVPWGLQASANLDMRREEYFYVSDKQHNPTRRTAWTGLLFDRVAKLWLVTAATPIDNAQGNHVATIGHDIFLNDLIQRTVENHLPGTYNMIFREDGRLIVHPDFITQIQKKQGNFNILESEDNHLGRIFKAVKTLNSDQHVVDNTTDHEYLAVTRLNGPGWYFVTVYPKSLLSDIALNDVKFILILATIALSLDILLLFSVLQNQIAKPLNQLLIATEQVTAGNFNVHLNTARQDELGCLANSFTSMATQLQNSFARLEQQKNQLEDHVQARTQELSQTLKELKRTQTQIVQSEKMSSLGQLVAGVAHEINNPVNFIHGNIEPAHEYVQDLLGCLALYQQQYPQPTAVIQSEMKKIDLEFLKEDLPKLLSSMRVGSERIREIVKSLRNFSRLDEADCKQVDIHEGLESTLMILQKRLKDSSGQPEIQIVKDYGQLPLIDCYPGKLNQVFMNILMNSIDALNEHNEQRLPDEIKANPSQIHIRTDVINLQWIKIAIADNGPGIPEATQARIFDPFFTTKPVGKGTGLGLSISYQIVTQEHLGKLDCYSTLGQGTEFVIEIPIQLE